MLGSNHLSGGSFAYGNSGYKACGGRIEDYGEPGFGPGDVIGCAVDIERGKCGCCRVQFFKNGMQLRQAYHFESKHTTADELFTDGLFPHIMLKNMEVELCFDHLCDQARLLGFMPIQTLVQTTQQHEAWVTNGDSISGVTDRMVTWAPQNQVLMLVGLPGSGKSTWAQEYVHGLGRKKKYYILSTSNIMDRLQLPTLQKLQYNDRFRNLMPIAEKVLLQLISIAPTKGRNILWDQTNTEIHARARKLKGFKGFKKYAAVFVSSPDKLLLRRNRQLQIGKNVPEDRLLQMQKRFILPVVGGAEGFDCVKYVGDLDRQCSEEQVSQDRALAKQRLAQRMNRTLPPHAATKPSVVTSRRLPKLQLCRRADGGLRYWPEEAVCKCVRHALHICTKASFSAELAMVIANSAFVLAAATRVLHNAYLATQTSVLAARNRRKKQCAEQVAEVALEKAKEQAMKFRQKQTAAIVAMADMRTTFLYFSKNEVSSGRLSKCLQQLVAKAEKRIVKVQREAWIQWLSTLIIPVACRGWPVRWHSALSL
jgi:predicted kinase